MLYCIKIQMIAEIVLDCIILCLSVMESMTVKMEMMNWIAVSFNISNLQIIQ